jgi:UDP-N-acetylglucosamine--N-acetylmuramyl-(pentapeptide) pyrophosphoryl-undecaprenol N-acetylglucosamine transferase
MQRGGAMVIAQSKLTPAVLADMIAERMADPDGLAATAAQAKAAGKPDATRLLADLAEAIASGMSISEFRSKRS